MAELARLVSVVGRLVERDVELLMCGFDVVQLVDEEAAAQGPCGRARSRGAAERLLDQRLADDDYRSLYVRAKSVQLEALRQEAVDAREHQQAQRQKELGRAWIPRAPRVLPSFALGLIETRSRWKNVFDDPDSVREAMKTWSTYVGFDSPDIEITQSVKNGLLPTMRDLKDDEGLRRGKRVFEQRVFGEGVSQEGLYDVVDKLVQAPDSKMELTQLSHAIEVMFTQEDVGTCRFRLAPVAPIESLTPWRLSLHSVDMKETPPLRLRTNYQPTKGLSSNLEFDPKSDPEVYPYPVLNLKPAPAPSPHQLSLPNAWSGRAKLVDHGSKQLTVQK